MVFYDHFELPATFARQVLLITRPAAMVRLAQRPETDPLDCRGTTVLHQDVQSQKELCG